MQKHRYFVDSEVDRIDLEDGDWVDIKAKLSIADQDKLSEMMLDIQVDTTPTNRAERRRRRDSGQSNYNATFRPSTSALLQVSVVDWSFTYEDGSKVPLNPEMINKMDARLANQLEAEINDRNPLQDTEPFLNTPTP